MRVLHITSWYPNHDDPLECLFVERHIEALRLNGEHDVWHITTRRRPNWEWGSRPLRAQREFRLFCTINSWYIIERIAFLLVVWAWLTRDRSRKYDLVNFYTAYPNAVSMRFLKRLFKVPVSITEQWTAYHYSFRSTSKGLDRIRRIFRHRVPVIVVSQALADDITRFSGATDIPFHFIDNVVEEGRFVHDPSMPVEPGRFFAIFGLRVPKRPDVLIDAIALLRERGLPARLRIAGYGYLRDELLERIRRLGLDGIVELIGGVEPKVAGEEMARSHALLHATDYETFSVVCAEALCCGTPVVASAVGPIPTFVVHENGAVIDRNEAQPWADAIAKEWDRLLAIDRAAVAKSMWQRTRPATVGGRYDAILRAIAHPSVPRP